MLCVLTTSLALSSRRYRREEMKIQAWENRRRQKAELQMKVAEVRVVMAICFISLEKKFGPVEVNHAPDTDLSIRTIEGN